MLLTNDHLIAFGIPFILMLCGALAKKIVRKTAWRRSDFFLGIELTLAALGAAMIFLYDLKKMDMRSSEARILVIQKIAETAAFLALALLLFLIVLSVHQEWDRNERASWRQVFWLGFVSNAMGVISFLVFVFFVKEG